MPWTMRRQTAGPSESRSAADQAFAQYPFHLQLKALPSGEGVLAANLLQVVEQGGHRHEPAGLATQALHELLETRIKAVRAIKVLAEVRVHDAGAAFALQAV